MPALAPARVALISQTVASSGTYTVYVGTTLLANLYVGTTAVTAAYVGTVKVFGA